MRMARKYRSYSNYRTYCAGQKLRYSDFVAQVDVLDRVQQFHAFAHWTLEGLATGDQTRAAAAFVYNGGTNCFGEVTRALRLATGINQPKATHVTVGHLIPDEVDWVFTRKLFINQLARLTVRATQSLLNRFVTTVSLGKLLFNDISLNSHTKMVCLAGEIGGSVHIAFRSFELRVAQIAPEDAGHAKFVRLREGFTDFSYLSRRFVRTKIYCGAHSDCPKIVCFFYCAKKHLIKLVRQRQELVMINLNDERNLVCIPSCNCSEHAEG